MKYLRKLVRYNNLKFHVFRNVYEPAEDTFLVADNIFVTENDTVLDMGTGCGMLAVLAAQKAKKVVAVDVNPHAIRCAKRNAEVNGVACKIEIRQGDLFQPVCKREKFSLITFNPPYLPSSRRESISWLGKSWAGGQSGRLVIDRFVSEMKSHLEENGRVLLVQSSLADVDETLRKFEQIGLNAKVKVEKKFFFETIVVIQASHLSE